MKNMTIAMENCEFSFVQLSRSTIENQGSHGIDKPSPRESRFFRSDVSRDGIDAIRQHGYTHDVKTIITRVNDIQS